MGRKSTRKSRLSEIAKAEKKIFDIYDKIMKKGEKENNGKNNLDEQEDKI